MKSLLLILTMLAGTQNPPAQPAANTPRGNAENGKTLFMKFGCFECHGREGQGAARTDVDVRAVARADRDAVVALEVTLAERPVIV